MIVNIHEAKTQLSRLLERVQRGEEIVIARAGRPVAKLVAVLPERKRIEPGFLRGKIRVTPDWDSPEVNEEIARELLDGEG